MPSSSLDNLIGATGAVVFHSPVTDLDALPHALEGCGYSCRTVELGMGNPDNRALFDELRERTGHRTLPQVFIDGEFVGGLAATREWLSAGSPGGPRLALLAGYAGLLPFALGLGLVLAGFGDTGVNVLRAYGAVILSFVGAIHWGLALTGRDPRQHIYAWSVVPALVAWVALLLPAPAGLVLLAGGLIGWRILETRLWPGVLPGWFERLRHHLTLGAGIMLVLAVVIRLY